MISSHINPLSGRRTLPPSRGRGRVQRALDLIPVDSDRWHPVGSYRSARCAATVASRLRHRLDEGVPLWQAEWRPGHDGTFDVYVRPNRARHERDG